MKSSPARNTPPKFWRQALADKTPGVSAEDVLDRLEQKYQSLRRNKR
jgi:hypothetical protein